MPIEASIEDLHDIQDEPSVRVPSNPIQTDAKVVNSPSVLDEKLDRELHYHKHGSYTCENQSNAASCYHRNSSNPFLQNHICTSDNIVMQPEQDRPPYVSSVHSWTKVEPVQPTSQEETWYRPTAGLYESMNTSMFTQSLLPMSASSPSLPQFNQQHPHSHFDRQQSWPAYPVSDTSAPEIAPGRLLNSFKSGSVQDPGKKQKFSLADSESRCLRFYQLFQSSLSDACE